MSRPKKMHKPLLGGFNEILSAVAMGTGKGKSAAQALVRKKAAPSEKSTPKKS
jgi:hypothetical protein